MTHAVGKGTVNVPVNMLVDERTILVRLAAERDVSLAALIRDLYLQGLSGMKPQVAQWIVDLRRKHRVALLAAVVAVLLVLGGALVDNGERTPELPALAGGVE